MDLWKERTAKLKRFIELDAPHVVTVQASVLVIRSFNGNSRWRAVLWLIRSEIINHYVGNARAFGYRLRYQMTGEDPDGVFIEQCDNCDAIIPEKRAGTIADGRVICCQHCILNPLGCRCKYGELGVLETSIDTGVL